MPYEFPIFDVADDVITKRAMELFETIMPNQRSNVEIEPDKLLLDGLASIHVGMLLIATLKEVGSKHPDGPDILANTLSLYFANMMIQHFDVDPNSR